MDIKEILSSHLEKSGYQLEKSIEGMDEATTTFRVCPTTRTPKEQLEHLCEVYTAYVKQANGEKHEWGSYKAPDNSFESLKKTLMQTRNEAVEQAMKSKNEKEALTALGYIQDHEAYHIGQLCLTRIQNEPEWNPYSIYRF